MIAGVDNGSDGQGISGWVSGSHIACGYSANAGESVPFANGDN